MLRDSYSSDITVDFGKKLVAYVIHRVSEVDSNVEGFDIKSIDLNGNIETIDENYLKALSIAKISGHRFELNIEEHLRQMDELAKSLEKETTKKEQA